MKYKSYVSFEPRSIYLWDKFNVYVLNLYKSYIIFTICTLYVNILLEEIFTIDDKNSIIFIRFVLKLRKLQQKVLSKMKIELKSYYD